jgi:hypothetical protein
MAILHVAFREQEVRTTARKHKLPIISLSKHDLVAIGPNTTLLHCLDLFSDEVVAVCLCASSYVRKR